MEIKGKKAIICGGASGMAKATAQLLRQKGADIAILDLPSSAGAEVAKELDGTFHEVDILDETRPSRPSTTPSTRSVGCTSRSTPPAAASASGR